MSDWGLRLTLLGSPAYNVAPFAAGVLRLTRGESAVDASGATWHTDYLADVQPPRERVDVVSAGNLSQIGQCQTALLSELVENAEAAGATFYGALLEVFGDIEPGFAPTPDWTGTVLDVARSGRTSTLVAGSLTASRHKTTLPLRSADGEEYPFARSVDLGRAIPLVYGDNENVPAIGVDCAIRGPYDPATGQIDRYREHAGWTYALAAYSDLVPSAPRIAITGQAAVAAYSADFATLEIAMGTNPEDVDALVLPGSSVDVYIEIVAGQGAGQVRRARLETWAYNAAREGNDRWRGRFSLSAPFSPAPSTSGASRSWVICYRRSLDFIVADAPIQGQSLTFPIPALFQVDAGERIPLPTASVAPATIGGLPGFRLDGNALNHEDGLNGRIYVPLYAAQQVRFEQGDVSDLYEESGTVDNLIDRNLESGYGLVVRGTNATASWMKTIVRLRIPPLSAFGVKTFEKAYLGSKWNYGREDGMIGVSIVAHVKTPLLDDLARLEIANDTQWYGYTGRDTDYHNTLPRTGPWTAGTPSSDANWIRYRQEIPGLTPETWPIATFVELLIGVHSLHVDVPLRVWEIGIFLETQTDLERKRLYSDVRGGRISTGRVFPVGDSINAPTVALADYYEHDLQIPPEQIDFAAAHQVLADHLTAAGSETTDFCPFKLAHTDRGPADELTVQICREWNIIASQTPSGIETFRHLLARVHTTEHDAAIYHDDLLKGSLAGWKPSPLLDLENEWDVLWDWTEPTDYRRTGRITLGSASAFPPSDGSWRQLVSAFSDWGLARRAWEICQESRARWGLVRRAKLEFRTVATDTALESILLPRNGIGLLEWKANRKREYSGMVARNHPLCALPLGSRILIQHPRFTRREVRYGVLVERQPLYRDRAFGFSVLCDPPKSAAQGDLYDTLDLADEILDTLSPATELEDQP